MQPLPEMIYPVERVREIDRMAIEQRRIPGYTLMTRAASAGLEIARRRHPAAGRWSFVAGPGNNGGDAYVMARLALAEGVDASVVSVTDPEGLRGDAMSAFRDYRLAGGRLEVVSEPTAADLGNADLLVDGLFGTGMQREVSGVFRQLIGAVNEHPAPVLALDIPSGIAGNTGRALGAAVCAEATVAFVALKPAYFLADGIDCCGDLHFSSLEIPDDCYPADGVLLRRIPDRLRHGALPRRRKNAHKGDFGHVLVVGGTAGMPGAAVLAASAALRSGAGAVTVATHPAHATGLVAACPELMVAAIESEQDLEPLLERASVVALGPGLGGDPWSRRVYEQLAADTRPAVWDAGALGWLADSPHARDARVMTPHPGEAARLLGRSVREVQADRLTALRELGERYAGAVVLKGAATLVSAAGQPPWVSSRGNPGMSTAGMGDVLTGVIAALIAQGLPPEHAACLGVDLHARAGDAAARDGERGTMASDLLNPLRTAVNP